MLPAAAEPIKFLAMFTSSIAEDRDGDLYFSVNMPDLPIATIGGGTRLETANEGLQIIDCAGTGKVNKFAEIFNLPDSKGRVNAQIWNAIINVYDDLYSGNTVNEEQFPGYGIS